MYPGTYKEFLWHKEHPDEPTGRDGPDRRDRQEAPAAVRARNALSRVAGNARTRGAGAPRVSRNDGDRASREEKKRADAEARRAARAEQARRMRIDELEARIGEHERAIREIETAMAAPGFYDDRAAAQPVIDRHQRLMWEVGDLMHQWETLQTPGVATATER